MERPHFALCLLRFALLAIKTSERVVRLGRERAVVLDSHHSRQGVLCSRRISSEGSRFPKSVQRIGVIGPQEVGAFEFLQSVLPFALLHPCIAQSVGSFGV